ncbi:MAG: phosphoribosylanthranilate isomerase [Oscillospiraceae bacterium]|nr:phosphoribosylanthranilate isomerase [Oscillospiraceae bacterium]
MTKIKLCGLSRPCDIEAVNKLSPDYIGFVFASKSRRYVSPEKAEDLKALLSPNIGAVGVFVDESPEKVALLLEKNIIDIAQLHGNEDGEYIKTLRGLSHKPIIKAFKVKTPSDIRKANESSADFVLLDSGAGTGTAFDWALLERVERPYFLAGGLYPENAGEAVKLLRPFALDVSSGIETEGLKDREKMASFVSEVRKADKSLR